MGRVITEKNKVKFEIHNKKDCILYLGHVIEYLEKKRDIYWRLSLEPLRYLAYELHKKEIYIDGDDKVIEFIIEKMDTDFDFDIDFYKFKLFNSAINLIKNEMINIIGDFSVDKLAISYNNYLDIIRKENIDGVKYEYSSEKTKLINFFNTHRNFLYHFSSDKLCEWIEFRERQAKKYKGAKFEMGKEFNIYISDTIPYKVFAAEITKNIIFLKELDRMIGFMKNDFESLIGEKVTFSIKTKSFDSSIEEITYNGFKSHNLSKKRKSK